MTSSPSLHLALTPPRRILLALPEVGTPTPTLLRALALSRLLRAELHVLRVFPERARSFPLFPHLQGPVALDAVATRLSGLDATGAWLDRVTGDGFEIASLEMSSGHFVEQVAAHAEALEAMLIVVPPPAPGGGEVITSLANAAQLKVLVGRAPSITGDVVAASALDDEAYPVLMTAADLARRFDSPAIAFHNLPPAPAANDTPNRAQARQDALEAAATRLDFAEAVLTRGADVGNALLEVAAARDADLVVIGTRPRGPQPAARVIERSTRSVLVVPLAGPRPHRGEEAHV